MMMDTTSEKQRDIRYPVEIGDGYPVYSADDYSATPAAATKNSKPERRETDHTIAMDDSNPSARSLAPSNNAVKNVFKTRLCYLVVAALGLAGFGFGVYILLDRMGWLPNVSRHEKYQGTESTSELALHGTADDCWVVYYDKVYVMTDYVMRHPGGSTIITNLCGSNATTAFEIYHAENLMKSVPSEFIGDLVANGTGNGASAVNAIEISEVANHNSNADCWVVYYNQIYDMTDHANSHPGGSSIITNDCGSDGTSSYANFHPESLLSIVSVHLIGDLVPDGSTAASSSNLSQPNTSTYDSEDEGLSKAPSPTSAPGPNCVIRGFTWEEIKRHNNSNDCWSVYHSKVYDMIEYQHPRNYVTQQCGLDGTVIFDASHPLRFLNFIDNRELGVLTDVAGDVPC